MPRTKKQSTEAAVREIRRRTRRKFSPEEKVRADRKYKRGLGVTSEHGCYDKSAWERCAGGANAHFALALVHHRSGLYDEAIAHYRRSIKITPNTDEVHRQLSRALDSLRIKREAQRKLVRSLSPEGQYERAAERYRETLAPRRQHVGGPPSTPHSATTGSRRGETTSPTPITDSRSKRIPGRHSRAICGKGCRACRAVRRARRRAMPCSLLTVLTASIGISLPMSRSSAGVFEATNRGAVDR